MPLVETILVVMGGIANATGTIQAGHWIYRWIRRISTTSTSFYEVTRQPDSVYISALRPYQEGRGRGDVDRGDERLPHLGGPLYYDGSQPVLESRPGKAVLVLDRELLRETFAPVLQNVDQKVVLTPVLLVKARIGRALAEDPGSVLIHPQPYRRDLHGKDSSHVPLLFYYRGELCIGWQKRAMIPDMLHCTLVEAGTTAANGTSPRQRTRGAEGGLIELPARRSTLFSTDENCRIRIDREKLEFECLSNQRRSFSLERREISGVHLDSQLNRLELMTRKGKTVRLEAKPEHLREVKEALVEL